MADPSTSPKSSERSSQQPQSDEANHSDAPQPSPLPSPSPSSLTQPNPNINPSPNPTPPAALPQLPVVSQPLSSALTFPSVAPLFRPGSLVPVPVPVPVPASGGPQFSPLPNPNLHAPNYQTVGVPPPGVSSVPSMMMPPVVASGAVPASVSSISSPYGHTLNPVGRSYAPPMLNGYQTMPQPVPQGSIPPPGISHYPSPYVPMIRMAFPPRPPGALGIIPTPLRPSIPGRLPIIPPLIRPITIPTITPADKPQTTVYVGKIASTVENEFMQSILQLCGSVKSWKRAQVPTNGSLKGFGFCEFESAEGVLRALRLLSKLSIDGQELVLNVDQATKEYLGRYVDEKAKKTENHKETKNEDVEKEEGNVSNDTKSDELKPSLESPMSETTDLKKEDNDPAKKDDTAIFGLVNDQDKEADQEALEKLTSLIEERVKTRPPPPPPPPQAAADGPSKSNSDVPTDSDVDITKNDATENKNDDNTNNDSKPSADHDRLEASSPDRNRRHDRRTRDRVRDLKREKERELERYEREREQERLRRERDIEYKIREDERRFKTRVKDWESRERKRKRLREEEEEIANERKQDREWLVQEQERENDDGYNKRRRYKSGSEERTRRQREKDEDLVDRLKEEEEIAEAKSRAEEEERLEKLREKEAFELLSVQATNATEQTVLPDAAIVEIKNENPNQLVDRDTAQANYIGEKTVQNGSGDESNGSISTSDMLHGGNVPARKLGFGLVGSGKRTAVPSVFNQEEDEDAQKEKKMRPLVPIDYSTEELQAVQSTSSGVLSPNLVAAAEFAKRISNVNPKEEKPDSDKEKSRRSLDRFSQRDRDRHHEEPNHRKDESKETLERDRDREHKSDKLRAPDNQKLLDAKQLIDMIPKTKEELFSYDINWAIYNRNKLHERMRPWISKKITEFLGEEEETLVSYIVSSTQEHVKASEMLERLQAILDDEAEMFVLKMWRMLIFEIKKVETGLALRSKS